MKLRVPDWQVATSAALFFLYGTLVHFALFNAYVRWAYPPGSNTSFVNHPLVKPTVMVLGGAAVAWFMTRLLWKRTAVGHDRAGRMLLRAGLYGILSTWATLLAFLVLASMVGSVRLTPWYAPLTFFYLLMGAVTYGMEPIMLSVPFAFAYGIVGGACILAIRRSGAGWRPLIEHPGDRSKLSVTLGILSIVFVFAPFVGLLFGILAIVLGVTVIKQANQDLAGRRGLAKIGVVLGGACILSWLWAAGGYVAARLLHYSPP